MSSSSKIDHSAVMPGFKVANNSNNNNIKNNLFNEKLRF